MQMLKEIPYISIKKYSNIGTYIPRCTYFFDWHFRSPRKYIIARTRTILNAYYKDILECGPIALTYSQKWFIFSRKERKNKTRNGKSSLFHFHLWTHFVNLVHCGGGVRPSVCLTVHPLLYRWRPQRPHGCTSFPLSACTMHCTAAAATTTTTIVRVVNLWIAWPFDWEHRAGPAKRAG